MKCLFLKNMEPLSEHLIHAFSIKRCTSVFEIPKCKLRICNVKGKFSCGAYRDVSHAEVFLT